MSKIEFSGTAFRYLLIILLACCQPLSAAAGSDTASPQVLSRGGEQVRIAVGDSALAELAVMFRASLRSGYTDGVVQSLVKAGNLYRERASYEEALRFYEMALSYCDTANSSSKFLATVYSNIGSIYSRTDRLRDAAGYYYRAAVFAERYPSLIPAALIYSNLSLVYGKLGQGDYAWYYSDRAERHFREQGDTGRLMLLLNNKGTLYVQQADWPAAAAAFREALQLGRHAGDGHVRLMARNNLAEVSLRQGNPELAGEYLREAAADDPGTDPYLTSALYLTGGEVSLALGAYGRAEAVLKEAIVRGRSLGIPDMIMEAGRRLAEMYEEQGEGAQALYYFRLYTRIRDSIAGAGVAKDIGRLEVRYQTAEKDRAIAGQQLEILRQQQLMARKDRLLGGSVAGILIISGAFILLRRSYRNRQRMLVQQQEIAQLQAMIRGEEQERGRMARELHDGIGGMLAAVKMNLGALRKEYPDFRGTEKLAGIAVMLEDTASEVRKSAHNLMPDMLTRYSLEEALGRYCSQVNAAHELMLDVQFHGALGRIGKSTELILYRTAQELIQNIIKHARASTASVQVMLQGNELTLTVEDDGIGYDTAGIYEGSGLENLRFRVAALGGRLAIHSAPGRGTTVYLEFDTEILERSELI